MLHSSIHRLVEKIPNHLHAMQLHTADNFTDITRAIQLKSLFDLCAHAKYNAVIKNTRPPAIQ